MILSILLLIASIFITIFIFVNKDVKINEEENIDINNESTGRINKNPFREAAEAIRNGESYRSDPNWSYLSDDGSFEDKFDNEDYISDDYSSKPEKDQNAIYEIGQFNINYMSQLGYDIIQTDSSSAKYEYIKDLGAEDYIIELQSVYYELDPTKISRMTTIARVLDPQIVIDHPTFPRYITGQETPGLDVTIHYHQNKDNDGTYYLSINDIEYELLLYQDYDTGETYVKHEYREYFLMYDNYDPDSPIKEYPQVY